VIAVTVSSVQCFLKNIHIQIIEQYILKKKNSENVMTSGDVGCPGRCNKETQFNKETESPQLIEARM
jgi:hypothetical protein